MLDYTRSHYQSITSVRYRDPSGLPPWLLEHTRTTSEVMPKLGSRGQEDAVRQLAIQRVLMVWWSSIQHRSIGGDYRMSCRIEKILADKQMPARGKGRVSISGFQGQGFTLER